MRKEVMDTVDRELGAIARPGAVHFVTVLPKTRSGKLLRRSIQALAEGAIRAISRRSRIPGALEQIRAALESTPAALRRASLSAARRNGVFPSRGDNTRLTAPPMPEPSPRLHAPMPSARRPMCRSLVTRGGAVESVHYGSVAVVDRAGRAAVRRRRSARADDDAQRAQAAAGGAVRRGRRRRALRVLDGAGGAALRQPFRRAAARDRRRRHAGAGGQSRGRTAMRHACADLFRSARRGAAAAAVFAARAQLLGQAQRDAGLLRPVRLAEGRLPRLRPSAAAGDPRARSRISPASPKPIWSAWSTAARRPITRCRSPISRSASRGSRPTR